MTRISIEEEKRLLARSLWDQGAIKFGEFKLKLHEKYPNAPLSPIFLNLRTPDNPKPGTLTADDVARAAMLMNAYVEYNEKVYFDFVAGIPNAGTPFAQSMIKMAGVQALQLGKVVQGDSRRIGDVTDDVAFEDGEEVLVVDDLITHADSKREAFESIIKAGLRVSALVVLVDREQGGADEIAQMGIPFISVFTLTELLDRYVQEGFLTDESRIRIREQLTQIDRYTAEHSSR